MQPDAPPPNYLWNVLKSGQSYRNIGYLLLTFPLGLMSFLILVIGISLGMGLSVIGVGVFILWGIFGLSSVVGNFERWISNRLLQTDLAMQEDDVFNLRNANNWRALGYNALKFPLGLLTFIFTTFIIALFLGMITMPLTYDTETTFVIGREVDTLWEAIVSSIIGFALAPFALILLGKLALLWRNMNRSLLRVRGNHTSKKKNYVSREEIEQDVINRLIDQGLVNEETLIEEQRRQSSYSEY